MTLDPEIAPALAAQAAAAVAAGIVFPERGDVHGLRTLADEKMRTTFDGLPTAPEVSATDHTVRAEDGAEVPLRWYAPAGPPTGAAVLYLHGGGMISGSLDVYDGLLRYYVHLTGVPFLAVGYRLAPEHRGETPARDGAAGLRFLADHAAGWGVDPARLAVMGDSGGGGVAAGVVLLAREQGLPVAAQILVYPMLDDRNTVTDPTWTAPSTWTHDNNFTGWHALLGADVGGPSVSAVAAPARLADFAGLPRTYIEVGELDIFRDESIDYAARLLRAGVSCELHVHPGAPHGHDWLNPDAALSRRAVADRIRVLTAL